MNAAPTRQLDFLTNSTAAPAHLEKRRQGEDECDGGLRVRDGTLAQNQGQYQKRRQERYPTEPRGGESPLFVIQKH